MKNPLTQERLALLMNAWKAYNGDPKAAVEVVKTLNAQRVKLFTGPKSEAAK